jgi:hypothetical protein
MKNVIDKSVENAKQLRPQFDPTNGRVFISGDGEIFGEIFLHYLRSDPNARTL